MVLMRSIMLALTGVKLHSPNSSPLLQTTPFILPTASLVAKKKTTFKFMLLTLVLFANDDYVIDRTVSRSISNKVND